MPAGWHVRPASPDDLDAVLAIEQACEDVPHWSPAAWLEALSEAPPTEPVRASFVADSDNGTIGFAVVTCIGTLAELESIAVSVPARGQGVGRALCGQVMDWSRNWGARMIELEVRASNGGASALYRSLGFVEQGIRRGYYRHPTEDAILMAAALQSSALPDAPRIAVAEGPVHRRIRGAKV
jgi:ribosomal-protein-alanine N-acetyltransferase